VAQQGNGKFCFRNPKSRALNVEKRIKDRIRIWYFEIPKIRILYPWSQYPAPKKDRKYPFCRFLDISFRRGAVSDRYYDEMTYQQGTSYQNPQINWLCLKISKGCLGGSLFAAHLSGESAKAKRAEKCNLTIAIHRYLLWHLILLSCHYVVDKNRRCPNSPRAKSVECLNVKSLF
jgi:hypothetical protein